MSSSEASDWKVLSTTDGRIYYWNAKLQLNQWVKPTCLEGMSVSPIIVPDRGSRSSRPGSLIRTSSTVDKRRSGLSPIEATTLAFARNEERDRSFRSSFRNSLIRGNRRSNASEGTEMGEITDPSLPDMPKEDWYSLFELADVRRRGVLTRSDFFWFVYKIAGFAVTVAELDLACSTYGQAVFIDQAGFEQFWLADQEAQSLQKLEPWVYGFHILPQEMEIRVAAACLFRQFDPQNIGVIRAEKMKAFQATLLAAEITDSVNVVDFFDDLDVDEDDVLSFMDFTEWLLGSGYLKTTVSPPPVEIVEDSLARLKIAHVLSNSFLLRSCGKLMPSLRKHLEITRCQGVLDEVADPGLRHWCCSRFGVWFIFVLILYLGCFVGLYYDRDVKMQAIETLYASQAACNQCLLFAQSSSSTLLEFSLCEDYTFDPTQFPSLSTWQSTYGIEEGFSAPEDNLLGEGELWEMTSAYDAMSGVLATAVFIYLLAVPAVMLGCCLLWALNQSCCFRRKQRVRISDPPYLPQFVWASGLFFSPAVVYLTNTVNFLQLQDGCYISLVPVWLWYATTKAFVGMSLAVLLLILSIIVRLVFLCFCKRVAPWLDLAVKLCWLFVLLWSLSVTIMNLMVLGATTFVPDSLVFYIAAILGVAWVAPFLRARPELFIQREVYPQTDFSPQSGVRATTSHRRVLSFQSPSPSLRSRIIAPSAQPSPNRSPVYPAKQLDKEFSEVGRESDQQQSVQERDQSKEQPQPIQSISQQPAIIVSLPKSPSALWEERNNRKPQQQQQQQQQNQLPNENPVTTRSESAPGGFFSAEPVLDDRGEAAVTQVGMLRVPDPVDPRVSGLLKESPSFLWEKRAERRRSSKRNSTVPTDDGFRHSLPWDFSRVSGSTTSVKSGFSLDTPFGTKRPSGVSPHDKRTSGFSSESPFSSKRSSAVPEGGSIIKRSSGFHPSAEGKRPSGFGSPETGSAGKRIRGFSGEKKGETSGINVSPAQRDANEAVRAEFASNASSSMSPTAASSSSSSFPSSSTSSSSSSIATPLLPAENADLMAEMKPSLVINTDTEAKVPQIVTIGSPAWTGGSSPAPPLARRDTNGTAHIAMLTKQGSEPRMSEASPVAPLTTSRKYVSFAAAAAARLAPKGDADTPTRTRVASQTPPVMSTLPLPDVRRKTLDSSDSSDDESHSSSQNSSYNNSDLSNHGSAGTAANREAKTSGSKSLFAWAKPETSPTSDTSTGKMHTRSIIETNSTLPKHFRSTSQIELPPITNASTHFEKQQFFSTVNGVKTVHESIYLRDLLVIPQYVEIFRNFLARNHALENLAFLETIRIYGAAALSDNVKLDIVAKRIYQEFLDQRAPHLVNLDSESFGRIEKAMKEGKIDSLLFEPAVETVVKLVEADVYRRFAITPENRQLITDSDAEVFANYLSTRHRRLSFAVLQNQEDPAFLERIIAYGQQSNLFKTLKLNGKKLTRACDGASLIEFLIMKRFADSRPAAIAMGQRILEGGYLVSAHERWMDFVDSDSPSNLYRVPNHKKLLRQFPNASKLLMTKDNAVGFVLWRGVVYNRLWACLSVEDAKIFLWQKQDCKMGHSVINLKGATAIIESGGEQENVEEGFVTMRRKTDPPPAQHDLPHRWGQVYIRLAILHQKKTELPPFEIVLLLEEASTRDKWKKCLQDSHVVVQTVHQEGVTARGEAAVAEGQIVLDLPRPSRGDYTGAGARPEPGALMRGRGISRGLGGPPSDVRAQKKLSFVLDSPNMKRQPIFRFRSPSGNPVGNQLEYERAMENQIEQLNEQLKLPGEQKQDLILKKIEDLRQRIEISKGSPRYNHDTPEPVPSDKAMAWEIPPGALRTSVSADDSIRKPSDTTSGSSS